MYVCVHVYSRCNVMNNRTHAYTQFRRCSIGNVEANSEQWNNHYKFKQNNKNDWSISFRLNSPIFLSNLILHCACLFDHSLFQTSRVLHLIPMFVALSHSFVRPFCLFHTFRFVSIQCSIRRIINW